MDVEIYCDESNQQSLSPEKPNQNRYFLIGGLWLPSENRGLFKETIHSIAQTENTFGEAKWRAVCPSKLPFYLKLVDFFFEQGNDLQFRCIVIDTHKIDLEKYHNADQELGYYKFCYQLMKNWIEDFNSYSIFVDYKTIRDPSRLTVLKDYLLKANLLAQIKNLQALPSNEVVLLQLADVLLGAVSAKFNQSTASQAKLAVIESIEQHLTHPIVATSRSVRKFNIFRIILR